MMKWLSILTAILLTMFLLVVPAWGDVQLPTVTDTGGGVTDPVGDTQLLLFGSTGGTSGFCMAAGMDPADGGSLVACTNEGATQHQLTVQGVPVIIGISCTHTTGMTTLDDGETVTFTPIFIQGSGAGAFNKTDSTVTTSFVDAADELEGDTKSNFATDDSPYTGSQAIQIRVDVTGAVTVTEIACAVLVTLDT